MPEASNGGVAARRPLLLLHLMALVAAVALTLVAPPALMQAVMRSFGPMSSWNRQMYLDGVITLALGLWTVALGPLALVANRRRLREAACSYGASTAFSSAVALGFLLASKAVDQFGTWSIFGWPAGLASRDIYLNTLGGMLHEIPKVEAAAVVTVWSILALAGVGRRPSGWAGALGLILGICWVAWCLVGRMVLLLDSPWLRGEVPPWG